MRQIGPGVHELCSDVQTNKKKTRKYYFLWKLKHKLVFHFIAEQYFLCCNALVNLKFLQTVHIGPHHPQTNLVLTPFVCQFNIQCFRCITSCTNVRTLSTTSTEFRIFLTYCQKFLPSICTVCLNLSSCLAFKPRRVCLKIENYHEVVLFWISWWKGLKKYRFLIKISFNRSK